MIVLTRLSGKEFALNSDLIERVESTPDTVITLVDGTKYVVGEDVDTVVQDVRLHRAEVVALSRFMMVELDPDAAPDPDHLSRAARPRRLVVVAPPDEEPGR